jgi:hypothetical protein
MHQERQSFYGPHMEKIEAHFEYPASDYNPMDDDPYFKDMPIDLISTPSTTIIENVQFIAKKLVENLNILGRSSV